MKILYIINRQKINKKGHTPLLCRITYNKKRKTFSTGQFVNPELWSSQKQKLLDDTNESVLLEKQLSLISNNINQAFLLLQIQQDSFTVEDIYRQYKGEKMTKDYCVVEFFETYLNKLKKLIGIDIKTETWNKFFYIKNDVKAFIKWKNKSSDLELKKLDANFLTELEYFYKTENRLKQITINKKVQRFKKVIKVAVSEGFLDKNPFLLHKPKTVRKEIVFLSAQELKRLEQFHFKQERLNFIKNLFVFSCYTGLPYIELMNLKHTDISLGFDNNKWIKLKRVKTSKELSIPLLPKAIEVMELFNEDVFVFPRISNQRYNSYLKEIASIVGIDKNLTTHIARKTFATTVLLLNDVPMEIVSELLGHSNIAVTQAHYGKIIQKKVSDEIEKLKNKVK